MRRGSALSGPPTTPERTSRRPTPLMETESTSSGSINHSDCAEMKSTVNSIYLFPVAIINRARKWGLNSMELYLAFFWLISSLKDETSFPNGVHTGSGEEESFEAPESGIEKETLLMTAVDREEHISSLGRSKESRTEQKRS
ncbi:hypothetical protein CEXT_630241 [Caerostris extrusa]|uniref:Uncharacterized protein n=1 Tax=Caerostris extrusa TaxID=172846 RepID=A0AAV4XXM1_CAEEX|nr:hypothetical protein CEXT_630241 [Caerostris extrusa]